MKSSSHLDVTQQRWTQPKVIHHQDKLSKAIQPHNEAVFKSIPPKAIESSTHYLAPEDFEGNLSPYWHLGHRLDNHKQLEIDAQPLTGKRNLVFVVYNPEHSRIQEAGYWHELVPAELHNTKNLHQLLQTASDDLKNSAPRCGIDKHHLERMLVRAPLECQLRFMTKTNQLRQGINTACQTIWKTVFLPHRKLRGPDDPAATCQDLLDQFYYCPRNVDEVKTCFDMNVLPEAIPGRVPPEEAIRCAMNCEWFCQLLETEGFEFSQQEKLLLIYASLLANAEYTPEDSARLFSQCFGTHFNPAVLNSIKNALLNINNDQVAGDARTQLFQHVLRFATRLPHYCRGGGTGVIDDKSLDDTMRLQALSVPRELMAKAEFLTRLKEAIQGSIDLMEVTGDSAFRDNRTRKRFDERHTLKPLNPALDKERQHKFRTSANLWQAMHNQLMENSKRHTCKQAGRPVEQTLQLVEIDLPDNFQTLDLVSVCSNEIQRTLAPLCQHIRVKGIARPTGNLSVLDQQKVNTTTALKHLVEQEQQKRIPKQLLDVLPSPSKQQSDKMHQARNTYLANNPPL